MSGWYDGAVGLSCPAAADLFRVHIDVSGTPVVGSHSLPGQYVRLSLEGAGEGAFAIASGPDVDGHTFELLVKRGGELADTLIEAQPGTRVRITAPQGRGFDLTAAHGRRILMFATGSGISAIRSLIEAIRRERDRFGPITLYFGARRPDAFAYREEFELWQSSGIGVVPTVSQPDAPKWEGLKGYVHNHLPQERLADAVAYVCGQSAMVNDVRQALRDRGMPDSQILLNV